MVLTAESIDLDQVKKNATYSLPVSIWQWLRERGAENEDGASGVIVELVRKAQEEAA